MINTKMGKASNKVAADKIRINQALFNLPGT